ncbi:MAG: DUF885 domain-containing protein [Candidatus Sulfotelmatobacter sp.]
MYCERAPLWAHALFPHRTLLLPDGSRRIIVRSRHPASRREWLEPPRPNNPDRRHRPLGKEVGFYQDPVSDYGRLSSALLRAVRLVVDTGIHSKGSTRDQVLEFMRKAGVADEPTIQSETDRYIAWPAQALSYKIGQLKFLELRQRARRELGSKFDIRRFNDEMLSGGSMPLDLLETRTDSWIAQQRSK